MINFQRLVSSVLIGTAKAIALVLFVIIAVIIGRYIVYGNLTVKIISGLVLSGVIFTIYEYINQEDFWLKNQRKADNMINFILLRKAIFTTLKYIGIIILAFLFGTSITLSFYINIWVGLTVIFTIAILSGIALFYQEEVDKLKEERKCRKISKKIKKELDKCFENYGGK